MNTGAPRGMSVRSRLLLLAVVPVLLATTILGVVTYRRASVALAEHSMGVVSVAAQLRESALARVLGRHHDRAQAFLRTARATCRDATCLMTSLESFAATEGALGAVLELPGEAPLLVGAAPATGALPPWKERQLAMLEPRGTQPRGYLIEAHEPGMRLVVRYDQRGWAPLFRDRAGLGESGETFLVDDDGYFLTPHRYQSRSGESHPIDARPMQLCLAGNDGVILAPDYRGADVIHAYRHIEEIGGGCIMAHIEQSEAFAGATELRRTFALAAISFASLAVLLALLVARSISRPMELLAARARRMAEGDLESEVPIEGPREIAALGRTLETMAGSVKRSTEGLSFLLDVSRVLSEYIDESEQALVRIAEVATTSIATYCVIDVLEAGELRRVAVAHRDPAMRETILGMKDFPPRIDAEGPWTRALRTGEVVRVDRFDEAVRRLIARNQRHLDVMNTLDARSVMMVPLRSGGRIAGVLTLAHADRVFDDADAALGEELANRAGVALDNARLYVDAREAARARERFLSIASHELRTPLTALNLHLEGLMRLGPDPRTRGRLDSVVKQVKRLRDLVEELLDVSRVTSGRVNLDIEHIDLNEVVRDVVHRLSPELARVGSPLELREEGPVTGDWDRLRLEQIVTNLLSNAAKYGGGKPIEITLGRRAGKAFVSVRDHGIGIASDDQARIFERFERAVSERNYSGFGLGLWITRQLVRALGGEIRVESVRGEGSTFTIELPERRSLAA